MSIRSRFARGVLFGAITATLVVSNVSTVRAENKARDENLKGLREVACDAEQAIEYLFKAKDTRAWQKERKSYISLTATCRAISPTTRFALANLDTYVLEQRPDKFLVVAPVYLLSEEGKRVEDDRIVFIFLTIPVSSD